MKNDWSPECCQYDDKSNICINAIMISDDGGNDYDYIGMCKICPFRVKEE